MRTEDWHLGGRGTGRADIGHFERTVHLLLKMLGHWSRDVSCHSFLIRLLTQRIENPLLLGVHLVGHGALEGAGPSLVFTIASRNRNGDMQWLCVLGNCLH